MCEVCMCVCVHVCVCTTCVCVCVGVIGKVYVHVQGAEKGTCECV